MSISTLRRALGALALTAAAAGAQAPRITPAGDPSVKADTIYRLAVDPKAHPEESSVYLLDDGVIRLEADGRGTTTYRQIVQILRPEAEENWQEMRFSYAPKHERFTLNWIRVVLPDGTVISEKPTQVQESDVPAQMGDPIYSDQKVIRVSLTGVKAGTIIDYSTTTEELKPFLAGDALHNWGVTTGLYTARSRYIVDLPAAVRFNLIERNLSFARTERVVGGRRVMTWATGNVKKVKPEAFAADSNGVSQSLGWSLPTTWAGIGAWYAGNAKGRYALTPEVEAKLGEILVGARSLDDSLRAIHRWVAQDVRYVSIALGLGGYQPRPPMEVLTSGYGDCKDKATIFVAMLNRIGVTAYPVLLNSTGGVQRKLASITQFDHAIAAFKRPGSTEYEFADLTASLTPFGELPYGPQGEFGIVVHPDGSVEEVTFPLSAIAANRMIQRVVATVKEDGTADAFYEEIGTGQNQYNLRSTFEDPMDSTQLAKLSKNLADGWFRGGRGKDLEVFAGKDLRVTPRVALRIEGGRALQLSGSSALLRHPFGAMTGFAKSATDIEEEPVRLLPIDPLRIFGHQERVLEYRLTLPEGWKAQLPVGVRAVSPFGTFVSEYSQTGREFVIKRTVTGAAGIQGPDQVKALTAWMREIAKDDAEVIIIQRP